MSGVGTEMAKLIPDWAQNLKKGCACKDMAIKWDKRGIEWCERNMNTLVNHIMLQSEHLIGPLRLVPDSLKRIGAAKLVRTAISNAKKARDDERQSS